MERLRTPRITEDKPAVRGSAPRNEFSGESQTTAIRGGTYRVTYISDRASDSTCNRNRTYWSSSGLSRGEHTVPVHSRRRRSG